MTRMLVRLSSHRPMLPGLPGLRRMLRPSKARLDPDRLVGIVCAASTAVALLVA